MAIGLGWGRDEILALTHEERGRWVQQVNRINARNNQNNQSNQSNPNKQAAKQD